MIPKSVACVFTFHHGGYRAALLETKCSTDWREMPSWSIEISRANGTTVAVIEQPYGIGRQSAVENIPPLMNAWLFWDRTHQQTEAA